MRLVTPRPLAASRAKLARAREHVSALNVELGPPTQRVVTVRAEHDADGAWYVDIPPDRSVDLERCSLVVGEVVYNLRCALEYVAHDLAVLDTGRAHVPDTTFPILTDDPRDRRTGQKVFVPTVGGAVGVPLTDPAEAIARITRGFGQTMRLLTPDHRAKIAACQPYRRGFGYDRFHPLAVLADLSNNDKHRAPALTYLGFASVNELPDKIVHIRDLVLFGVGTGPEHSVQAHRLHLYARATGANPQVEMQLVFTPQVSLADGAIWMRGVITNDVIAVLTVLADTVEAVLALFAADFDP